MNDQDKKHEKILLRLPDVLAMVPISRSKLFKSNPLISKKQYCGHTDGAPQA